MFCMREHANQPTEHQLEAALRILWRKFGNRRLFSDNELQFGDEVNHKPSVWVQSFQKDGAPARELSLALAEKPADQALESLRERRVGDIALVLVELAGSE